MEFMTQVFHLQNWSRHPIAHMGFYSYPWRMWWADVLTEAPGSEAHLSRPLSAGRESQQDLCTSSTLSTAQNIHTLGNCTILPFSRDWDAGCSDDELCSIQFLPETSGVLCAGLLCTITTNRPGTELGKSGERIKWKLRLNIKNSKSSY